MEPKWKMKEHSLPCSSSYSAIFSNTDLLEGVGKAYGRTPSKHIMSMVKVMCKHLFSITYGTYFGLNMTLYMSNDVGGHAAKAERGPIRVH